MSAPAAVPKAPAPPAAFTVRLPAFGGTLGELAAALRAEQVLPSEVPLLRLTREVLVWAREVTEMTEGGTPTLAESHPDLLPALANVIALKARLLLPRPEPESLDEVEDGIPDDVLGGVEALAELGTLVSFLAGRRREREGLIPGRAAGVTLPRRERPRQPHRSLAKLVLAAQNAVRQVEVPLLSRERLTLQGALAALRVFGGRLRTFGFWTVHAEDWGERTTYFAALLEGVKEGSLGAEQEAPYSEIRVTSRQTEG